MIQLLKVESDMNRVRMKDDRFKGSMYLTPDSDLAKLTASADFKSLVKEILKRPHDEETNSGGYFQWNNIKSREIWAIQHYLLHK